MRNWCWRLSAILCGHHRLLLADIFQGKPQTSNVHSRNMITSQSGLTDSDKAPLSFRQPWLIEQISFQISLFSFKELYILKKGVVARVHRGKIWKHEMSTTPRKAWSADKMAAVAAAPGMKLKEMDEKNMHNLFLKNMAGLIEEIKNPSPCNNPWVENAPMSNHCSGGASIQMTVPRPSVPCSYDERPKTELSNNPFAPFLFPVSLELIPLAFWGNKIKWSPKAMSYNNPCLFLCITV